MERLFKCCKAKSSLLYVFRDTEGRSKLISDIQENIAAGINALPIDFDSFDYNIDTKFYQAWDKYMHINFSGEILHSHSIINSLLGNISVFDVNGKNVGKWAKGIPSGMFATNFLGSLFNAVGQRIVAKKLDFKPAIAFGDDGVIFEKIQYSLQTYEDYFRVLTGEVVNSTKNWRNPKLTEFLKQVITKDSVYQYPARIFSSLCWAFPDYRNTSSYERLTATAGLWKEWLDRTGKFSFPDFAYADIQRSQGQTNRTKLSIRDVKIWTHMPLQLGGFGLVPINTNFRLQIKSVRRGYDSTNLLFKRYPMQTSYILGYKLVHLDLTYAINTFNHKIKSLFFTTGTTTPNFEQYIEWLRASIGLPSIYILYGQLKEPSTLPFRVLGLSDSKVSELYSVLSPFKNITSWLFDLRLVTSTIQARLENVLLPFLAKI